MVQNNEKTAEVLKAERIVQTTDGYLSFNSEEQEIEYSALVKKAEELNDKIEYESTYSKEKKLFCYSDK